MTNYEYDINQIPSQEKDIIEKENQRKADTINRLNIGPSQKADIMLVSFGLKPATELSLYKWNDSTDIVENTLKEAGLVYEGKTTKKGDIVYAIARNNETIEKLMNAEADSNHYEYGKLMGYPQTAIDAFTNKTLLNFDKQRELPELKGNIIEMRLSRDHYIDEAKQLQSLSETIKKYAPDLYKSLIGN